MLKKLIFSAIILGTITTLSASNPKHLFSYVKQGVVLENIIVAKDNEGTASIYGSITKITDGCRIIYVMNSYVSSRKEIITGGYNNVPTIAVSDIGCQK